MLGPRHWLLVAMLLATPLASAQEKRAESAADTSPTAWSCTVETLVSGVECVFETEAEPVTNPDKQAVENARKAAALAKQACARAARRSVEPIPDPSVLAACKGQFVEKAMACGIDGTSALLDSSGRFSPEMRVCYFAMADVLARTQFMVDTTAQCCRCLLANRCMKPGERCNYLAASGHLEVTKCLQNECADSCRAFVPDPGPPRPPLAPSAEAPPELPAKRLLREGKMIIHVPAPRE